MPYSRDYGKNITKDWFDKRTDIKTIVDLGAGSGTYPKLLGNKYIWKAVEIWAPYIKRFGLDKLYKEIRIGDIQYMELPDGDCAILGDCLEHLNKESAIKTFIKVDSQFKHVIISIPIALLSHRNFEGNEFESHLSTWTWEELNNLVPLTYKIRKQTEPYKLAIFIK